MKIVSNDSIQLEELYRDLKRDGQEVTLEKTPVKDAMGFDIVLNLDVDMVRLAMILSSTYLANRGLTLFLKKSSGESEPIDVEVLKEPKKLEELDIDRDATLYIEYKKR